MDRTLQDPMVGRLVDSRYLIESRIARGGMATVYLAKDHRLERDVALKVMHQRLTADDEFVTRFVREARASAKLSHPNVVQVFDQGFDGAIGYLTMEYLPGRTLRDVLAGRGALTPRESVSVLEPVLSGLAAAHRAGIVHGDVKPENVILADDGRIKVADFGLARAGAAPITGSSKGELLGTVAYLAPELVTQGTADARADVYAAGIMLFELLTGRRPYVGDDPVAVAYRHVNETVPAPSSLAPRLPAAFDQIVLQATAHDPDRRPPNAGALLADLRAAASSVPDPQLDVRAAERVRRRDLDRTQIYGPSTAVGAAESAAGAGFGAGAGSGAEPGSAGVPGFGSDEVGDPAQAQQTRALAMSRRQARRGGAGPGQLVPRLKVHEEQPGTRSFLGEKYRLSLAAVGAALAVVVLILAGIWWVSSGPGSYLDTPPLVGERAGDAQVTLSTLGLTNQVDFAFNAKVAAGQVLSTKPAGGQHVRKNGLVVLVVSKGPQLYGVPSVKGMTVDDATTAIENAHLKVGKRTTGFSATVAEGKVISTSPKQGTLIAPGRAVDLVLSKGGSLLKGAESGLCATAPADGNGDARITLQNCDGSAGQAWNATSQQQLQLGGGNRCLDVEGGATNDGAGVQIYACNGGNNQQWTVKPDGTVVSAASGKCLDVTEHGRTPGSPIEIWDCNGGDNQKWSVT